ncbi:recombination mediator RecR [Methylogaea oryzae]|uniref:Recombination protein RecR n=1 Tax=Methylogaea oryzae TaxID=1295382 RepID=A0A8D4VQA6_9GAMM|nr:recombination mediator RecR [Methylogaea oryzae]BBL71752.1 recombination protein RecR [Methylogaea oryzae]
MQAKGHLGQLIHALRCLPGVGPKSAQRMAFHLLLRNREGAKALAQSLLAAVEHIGYCEQCRGLSEEPLCSLCASANRDHGQLCVVEMPTDVYAIDQAGCFRGVFFVLNGRLSPLDGIGPAELGMDLLEQRLAAGEVKEVVLATNTTVEGEATAHYIGEMAQRYGVRTTRIAYGVPLGGELEYIDGATLSLAFNGRRDF